MIRIAVTAFAAVLLSSTAASADIIRPGTIEKLLAADIRNAGHSCTQVVSYGSWNGTDADDLRSQGLIAYRAHCSNGMVFGVGAVPIRRNARMRVAEAHGGTLPAPVVRRLR